MKVYAASFPGHYIGGHAVVVAPDEPSARKLLRAELETWGVHGDAAHARVTPVNVEKLGALVMSSGDY